LLLLRLHESRKLLASLPKEPLETLAHPRGVVAKAAPRAVKPSGASLSLHGVRTRGTLLPGAISPPKARVALAPIGGVSIKTSVVQGHARGGRCIQHKILLGLADTMT